jgi:hypothetical protein
VLSLKNDFTRPAPRIVSLARNSTACDAQGCLERLREQISAVGAGSAKADAGSPINRRFGAIVTLQ